MKRQHYKTFKIHTLYNIVISAVFVAIIILERDTALLAATVFLLFYLAGNGIIHTSKNKLDHDTLIEYVLLSGIALILLVNALVR